MQIRLTVLAPRSGRSATSGHASVGHTSAGHAAVGHACDVLITAPAGTALAAVANGLAAAVSGPDVSGSVVLYAGQERLDAQRRTLGEPPLVDGAVLSLQVPHEDESPGADAAAQLHVVAGPDAGGVHLLHGGRIRIGRSAEADVPLDDPDVSRLHCAVTVAEDGRVTVADLGSTNGTTLDGVALSARPVRLPAGALLRLGESTLRVTPRDRTPALPTAPDGEGHLRVTRADGAGSGPGGSGPGFDNSGSGGSGPGGAAAGAFDPGGPGPGGSAQGKAAPGGSGPADPGPGRRVPRWARQEGGVSGTGGYGPAASAPGASGTPEAPQANGQHRVPVQYDPTAPAAATSAGLGDAATLHTYGTDDPDSSAHGDTMHSRADETHEVPEPPGAHSPAATGGAPRQGAPFRGTRLPDGATRRRGIGAWARRLAGGREEPVAEFPPQQGPPSAAAPAVERWPDPAAVLLTALGPGPRLWERGQGHPESLVLRLGTTERAELPSVPVTVGLREAGSLGLAGPRARLAGLARSAVAQLAALHSPADLEIVLLSTDRSRSLDARKGEWAWLGWLPHLRPAHGQDCRLLLAYDRDQATARSAELTRRLDDGPLGPGWPSADRKAVAEAAARYEGARTVVIVDGDPGSAALREATARLAGAGSAAGIHLICLAETPAASPLSPVAATYESACAASLAFRECGAVALLSGDVATALRLMRTAGGQPVGHGTVGAVDAVSAPWAERFGRAVAPLRAEGTGTHLGRVVALPRSARLLDELGLARATPASLMARWASAGDGTAVLGAGPRGPLTVDLTEEGPHLLIEGPAGSGRTELLRSVAASLAAAGRPDLLGLLLVDGAGGERGEGLTACTELPHVTDHLVASDPVRMRAFAQALGAELKRRSELLGSVGFTESHTQGQVAGRMVSQRPPSAAEQRGDLDSPASGTLRLRPGARTKAEGPPPLPRLVVLVDDFDALVAPALGSPGRPAAGSVVRALEAVARDGERLGVHLIATSARPDRTADTELTQGARLRVVLDAPPAAPGPEDPAPGRGRLGHPDGRVTPFQSGRVTGRIPRTATSRPTVVPVEWERMGDPPTRRPVRELGNGPTDLALLASALERAARSVDATPIPPLTPARP
ncbi:MULTISPECIES: FHA domain-containing protein [unclassified Streptomyces]|uniref:FHA domain-containing protein n=1 Tax=unclassified Streptomyces TaxID=2593676 RepID=UPI002DD89973|nr:FHA domain-containing protein [Streptomyces sp. NBC_01750]WSB02513.1 FHA domain-containing protein [Streptomyces sp. NBC_01794]WSD33225.1 FHA domain-containing protein [Streptomyces sp. NBC_01750]